MKIHAPLMVDRVFVAHVKKGYEARRESIERQMEGQGIPFEFMLDGDIPDLDADRLAKWFPRGTKPDPAVSCATKHLLIYERIVQDDLAFALVLEDDIFLADDFVRRFNETVCELHARTGSRAKRAWVSYENSTHRVPPKADRRGDRLLYSADSPRCTGAYLIGSDAARYILDCAASDRSACPIDWYVGHVASRTMSQMDIYWCHPTIAEQGSMNGCFDSMDSRRRAGWMRRVKWQADKLYKAVRSRAA